MDIFREYLSATTPANSAPTKAPISSMAVMSPLLKLAPPVTALSVSGKVCKNWGITKMIEIKPWFAPNEKPARPFLVRQNRVTDQSHDTDGLRLTSYASGKSACKNDSVFEKFVYRCKYDYMRRPRYPGAKESLPTDWLDRKLLRERLHPEQV